MLKAVIDTNVMVSALRSRRGWSFEVISRLFKGDFKAVISVPMIFEYESVLTKHFVPDIYTTDEIEGFIDSVCSIAEQQNICYLWRPLLTDAYDDHVLELALASNCRHIITFNTRDFKKAEELVITAIEPQEFIMMLEE